MPKSVICSDCPCLNNDNEYGEECNLGYETRLMFAFDKCDRLKPAASRRTFSPCGEAGLSQALAEGTR